MSDEEVKNSNEGESNGSRRLRIASYVVLGFFIAGIVALAVWWFEFRDFESTDDAYVAGNMVWLSSRQDGTVISYYADDTDFVEMGQLLVKLDPTDFLLAFEQHKTSLALAARQVSGLFQQVQQSRASVKVEQANYEKALMDFENRNGLVDSQAISKEDFQHVQTDLAAKVALVELSRHQLKAAEVALGTTELRHHPIIEDAIARLKESYLALQRCAILSPVTGFVAKRSVQAGQTVKAAAPLMSIIPLDNLWINANYKETQLENIRIGQPVHISADIYGSDVDYHGTVAGIIGGSGSVFSVLPPQNASGNWIKIVQRVPVRINLDPKEIKANPLFLGLSVYVTTKIVDTSGAMLASVPSEKVQAKTTVFDIPLDELNILIEKIIQTNFIPE